MKKLRGYIFSRSFLGERVPQNVQNLVIRDYCRQNGYQYLLSSVEYAMEDSNLMLNSLIKEIDKIKGIVLYSYFQLPKNKDDRIKILNTIIKKKKSLHFALENSIIKNIDDVNKINEILNLKKFIMNSNFYNSTKNYLINYSKIYE